MDLSATDGFILDFIDEEGKERTSVISPTGTIPLDDQEVWYRSGVYGFGVG